MLEGYIRTLITDMGKVKNVGLSSIHRTVNIPKISESRQGYLESYHYGQILDLVGSLLSLFEIDKVREDLEARIHMEIREDVKEL